MADAEQTIIAFLEMSAQKAMRLMMSENLARLRNWEPNEHEIANLDRRLDISVTLPSAEYETLPSALGDAIEWLAGRLAEIPEELRSSARIETGACDYGDDATLSIVYVRPETDEEMTARRDDVMRRLEINQAARRESERAEYERLK